LVIWLFAHLRLKAKHRQLEQERQLMLAEQRALRSQMNPHFIFNALNSIRRFILENDMDKADYYLTSFATLMRRVLDNSRQNFITLENELQTLELYLELERMRFDHSFSFYIDVDPQIDIHNWLIPPMIIQPFAENAIWHGLAMKPSGGKLLLSFKLQGDRVLCIVEDNGIGRQKAAQIAAKRKGHKSTGLANTKERLDLLYKLYGKRIELKITDLYDENGEPAGTRVELSFPNFADVRNE
jgi:sensor histidine kinase YesM